MNKMTYTRENEPSTTILWSEFLGYKGSNERYRVLAQINGKRVDLKVLLDRKLGRTIFPIPSVIRRMKWNERDSWTHHLNFEVSKHLFTTSKSVAADIPKPVNPMLVNEIMPLVDGVEIELGAPLSPE